MSRSYRATYITSCRMLAIMEGAVPFFELGLKLGKIGTPQSAALALEIQEYIKGRKKQVVDQINLGGEGNLRRGG